MRPDIYLTDRTTIITDQECGQKRWWMKEAEGGGIVPLHTAPWLTQGIEYHHDNAQLVQGVRLEEVLDSIRLPLQESYEVIEPVCRRIGMATAFDKWVKPQLLNGRRVVTVEDEMILDRTPLWIAFTNDLTTERLSDGLLEVIDYKGFSRLGKGWFDHWPFSIQLHINIAGTQEELGRSVASARVIGWDKGEERDGKLRHPYVWAYYDEKSNSWTPDYKWGLTLRPVWEYNEAHPKQGIVEWVERLGEDVAMDCFPFAPPVTLDERILAATVSERLAREKSIREGSAVFEHCFERCRPAFGPPCGYLLACHNATINESPLASGLFIRRTPHHDVERIGAEVGAEED